MVSPALLSSAKPDWETPDHCLESVRSVAPITLDPCTTAANPTGARFYWHPPVFDGLARDWEEVWRVGAGGLIYVNPPYGLSIGKWVEKCASVRAPVLALLPARTDTRWFPWSANVLCFVRGRIKFRGATASAPFPSVFALWNRDIDFGGTRPALVDRFTAAFHSWGTLIYL